MSTHQSGMETAKLDVDSVSGAIVRHIAESADRDMTELPPLYETIDPDALDTLLDSLDEDNTAFSLEFTYAGQHISINTGGTVSCDQE